MLSPFISMVFLDLVVQVVQPNLVETLQVVQLKKQLAQAVVEILVSVQIQAREQQVQVLQTRSQILQLLTAPVEPVVRPAELQVLQVQMVQLKPSLGQVEMVAEAHLQALQGMQVRVRMVL
jgi:hypothetical protein